MQTNQIDDPRFWQGPQAQHQCGLGCPCRQSSGYPHTVVHQTSPIPNPMSIASQMGADPMSKLAAAIHDLAAALRETNSQHQQEE
jgi:hypothetical protein